MPPRYRVAVILGSLVGLRSGEVRGLRIRDVNPLRSEITVHQQIVREKGMGGPEIPAPPKTRSSRRTVPVDPATMSAITTYISEHPPSPPGHPGRHPHHHALRPARGRQHPGLRLAHRLPQSQDPAYPFHSTRHAYCSTLISQGIPLFEVARRLGHSNTQQVESTYGHLYGDADSRTRHATSGQSAQVLQLPTAATGS